MKQALAAGETFRFGPLLLLVLLACSCERASLSTAAPTIEVQPLALDFGPVPVGIAVSLPLHVRSLGRQPLVLEPVSATLADFTGLTSALELAAGERRAIEISFTPASEGERTGFVHLPSNAENDPEVAIAVTGQGTARLVCTECNSPPASYCASPGLLITYEPHGSCVGNKCEYEATSSACVEGCVAATARCGESTDAGSDAGADGGPGQDAGAADAGWDAGFDAGVDAGQGPVVFDAPGETSWVVPAGVTSVTVKAWGGGGAGGKQLGSTGGGAAFVRATLPVTPGESLLVWVAEGGVAPGNGGGLSALVRGTTSLVVAAGGGGGGSDGCSGTCVTGGRGGAGGGAVGQDGQNIQTQVVPYCTGATGGRGGTATQGGLGGTSTGTSPNRCTGQPGQAMAGGRATGVNGNCDLGTGASTWHQGGGQGNGGGGAGGAGYFGGGGAGFIWTYCSGGGGGGASYIGPLATQTQMQEGLSQQQGNPLESSGAGLGGSPANDGASGRVVLTY